MPAFEKLETGNKEELLKVIRSTKQKMGWLRNKMEHPDYRFRTEKRCPSELVAYKCERDYLNLAIAKYISLGGEYVEPAISLKDTRFNNRLEDISKITLIKSAFAVSSVKTVVDLTGDKVKMFSGSFDELYEKIVEIEKEEFIYQLGELHIGEWRSHYSPKRFGIEVCDGEQWVLKFEYKDGKKKFFSGDNAYPYNFDELLELLF